VEEDDKEVDEDDRARVEVTVVAGARVDEELGAIELVDRTV
jgi:hypothetical protein